MSSNPVRQRLAAIVCVLSCAAAAMAGDWPQWRHDAGRTACSSEAPGQRVFDVLVQGRRVLEALDVAKAAGGPRKVVISEIRGVDVAGVLTIELKAVTGGPILCGVEAIAQ
jgi:hypothetical protein